MSDIIFSFENLSIRNYNKIIFEDLNFHLRKGEHWALVGQSGSGKTVFLDAVAGKTSFPKGAAGYPLFEEYIKKYRNDDPTFNKFKLISQVSSRHHFRNLSNTTDFYYQQRFNSMDSEDSESVQNYLAGIEQHHGGGYWTLDRVIRSLRLTPLIDKQLIKLSNGETKRLLIAGALIRNPLLLLLDNPLTGLDVNSRAQFNELFAEIAGSGISIMMATSPEEIPDIITHVAVLSEGKIQTETARAEFDATQYVKEAESEFDVHGLDELLQGNVMSAYNHIVHMENVTISYGDKVILDKVSWTVNQSERWMLLGPNGAGKSTMLSLINGDNPQAFANKIILFDKQKGSGESIWDIKKKIGFVSPELFQYFPTDSSCIQVIESGFYDTMGLFRQSGEKRAGVCRKWMELLGIANYSTVLFKNVPVSVQRLCLLARALVKNPPLLILDEPCQGLDDHQQRVFRFLVDQICNRTNVSLIYVSHYEKEKPESVTKVIRLEAGRRVDA